MEGLGGIVKMIDMLATFSNGKWPLNKEQAEKEALNLGYETLLCITNSGRSSYLDLACAFVFPSERIMEGVIKNKNFKEEYLKKIYSIKKEKQYWTPGEYILEVNALLRKE